MGIGIFSNNQFIYVKAPLRASAVGKPKTLHDVAKKTITTDEFVSYTYTDFRSDLDTNHTAFTILTVYCLLRHAWESPLRSSRWRIFTTNTGGICLTKEEARGASFKLAFQFVAQVYAASQTRTIEPSRTEAGIESSSPDIFDVKLAIVERSSVIFAYIRIYIYPRLRRLIVLYPRFMLRWSSIATFRPSRISRISSRLRNQIGNG